MMRTCVLGAALLSLIAIQGLAQGITAKADLKKKCPYPERTKAELEAVGGFDKPRSKLEPLHIILASSKKDHGPEAHDYPFIQKRWAKLLPMAENVTVDLSNTFPSDEQYEKADMVLFFCRPFFNEKEIGRLNAYLSKGGGAMYVHIGVLGVKGGGQRKNAGLCWEGNCRFRHGKVTLNITDKQHPITQGFTDVTFYDESYWALKGDSSDIHILATSDEGKPPAATPQLWTMTVGKGRVHANILGHFSWSFDDPLFRVLMMRGIAWTAKSDINRFHTLYTIGAHYKE